MSVAAAEASAGAGADAAPTDALAVGATVDTGDIGVVTTAAFDASEGALPAEARAGVDTAALFATAAGSGCAVCAYCGYAPGRIA